MGAGVTRSLHVQFERITFEQGNEFAPDAPWGYLRVTLSSDGQLEFEQKHHGARRLVRGTVNRERVAAMRTHLARTSFPTPPETMFPPGSSLVVLAVEQPAQRMLINYFTGLKLDGYRELIRELSALNDALRESNADILAQWEFVAATVVGDGT